VHSFEALHVGEDRLVLAGRYVLEDAPGHGAEHVEIFSNRVSELHAPSLLKI